MEHLQPVAFEVKDFDERRGIIHGYASIAGNLDDGGDVVMPGAFAKTLGERASRVKALYGHNFDRVVGRPLEIDEDGRGLRTVTQLAVKSFWGNEVYELARIGALDEMSIGYQTVQHERQGKARQLKEVKLYEYSFVPLAMNSMARVTSVKALLDLGDPDAAERLLGEFTASLAELKEGRVLSGRHRQMVVEIRDRAQTLLDAAEPAAKEADSLGDGVEEKGVVPFKATAKAPEGAAWDGPAAVKALWAKGPASLRAACAWYDSAAPDVQASYKLPHHDADGAVVWRGVAAAMAALLGSRGGVDIPAGDRRGVYNHLAGHYRQFDKEAPEFKSLGEIDAALRARDIELRRLRYEATRMLAGV